MNLLICFVCAVVSLAQAEDIDPDLVPSPVMSDVENLEMSALLKDLVMTHDRVLAAEAGFESAEFMADKAWSGWLPRVDLAAEGGYEDIDRTDTELSRKWRNEITLTVTQLVYDFGGTQGSIQMAEAMAREFNARLDQVRQDVVIQGVTAYLMVIRSREMHKYIVKSEERIKELSGMQEALVERGAGLSYEDLQVKGQLAGVQAQRIDIERSLQNARNNFRSVFNIDLSDEDVDRLVLPKISAESVPESLEEALALAFQDNPYLIELDHAIDRTGGNLRTQRSTLYPKFELVGEAVHKEQDQGASGFRDELRGELRMSYNLYNGGGDVDAIDAAKAEVRSAKKTKLDRRRTVEENVRNAWVDMITLKKNVVLYENRANLTWEFLTLVERKRALGAEVQLLDILVGHRDYISAVSAQVTADIDSLIATYTLFYQMGRMTPEFVGLN